MKSPNIDRLLGIYEKAINNKFSWEEKILIAKEAGYDFIEFSVDESDDRLARLDWTKDQINDLKQLLIKHDFFLNSMTLSGHRRYPFGSKDSQIRAKAFEIMEKAILLAKALGIRIVQLAAYDVFYEPADAQTRALFIDGIKKATQMALKHSVYLAFETMDTPFAGTISNCLEFVKEVQSPFLGIYPDLGNLTQFATDYNLELEKGQHNIVACHFKDTKPNVFRDLDFGSGTVDFVNALAQLNKINFSGPIMVEMWSKNQPEETFEENVAYIAAAKQFYLKQLELANND